MYAQKHFETQRSDQSIRRELNLLAGNKENHIRNQELFSLPKDKICCPVLRAAAINEHI